MDDLMELAAWGSAIRVRLRCAGARPDDVSFKGRAMDVRGHEGLTTATVHNGCRFIASSN
jgi:hypothetical protein